MFDILIACKNNVLKNAPSWGTMWNGPSYPRQILAESFHSLFDMQSGICTEENHTTAKTTGTLFVMVLRELFSVA